MRSRKSCNHAVQGANIRDKRWIRSDSQVLSFLATVTRFARGLAQRHRFIQHGLRHSYVKSISNVINKNERRNVKTVNLPLITPLNKKRLAVFASYFSYFRGSILHTQSILCLWSHAYLHFCFFARKRIRSTMLQTLWSILFDWPISKILSFDTSIKCFKTQTSIASRL